MLHQFCVHCSAKRFSTQSDQLNDTMGTLKRYDWIFSSAQFIFGTYWFNDDQKRRIVQIHNQLRASEPASNMQEMVWDDRLAALALGHVQRSDAWHRSGMSTFRMLIPSNSLRSFSILLFCNCFRQIEMALSCVEWSPYIFTISQHPSSFSICPPPHPSSTLNMSFSCQPTGK